MRNKIIHTKQIARKNGEKYYLSDVPCKNGHYQKYTKNSLCVECARDRSMTVGYKPPRCTDHRKRYQFSYDQKNPAKYLLHGAKCRAKKKNIECSITEADIVIPDRCPIVPWIKLGKVRGNQSHDTPTVDRIDNTKGYIPGNVRVVSWFANKLKGDMSLAEIEELACSLYAYVNKVPLDGFSPETSYRGCGYLLQQRRSPYNSQTGRSVEGFLPAARGVH